MENGGTYICRELLSRAGARVAAVSGANGATPPEARTEEYYKKRPCAELCRYAADLLDDFISQNPIS